MWTFQRMVERAWVLKLHLETWWSRYWYDRGETPLQDLFFTPQGWVLTSHVGEKWGVDYFVHLIDGGHYIKAYPLRFDEFVTWPGMETGFFIPF